MQQTESYEGQETDSSQSDFLRAEHSHWAIDVAIDRIGFTADTFGLCGKYSTLLDQFYRLALSNSTDFTRLLEYLPGFATWKSPIPVEWLEDIYGVPNEILLPCLERNSPLIRRWQSYFWIRYSETQQPFDVLNVNTHLSNFLFRQRQAGPHYQDPQKSEVGACRHLITMVFHAEWVKVVR